VKSTGERHQFYRTSSDGSGIFESETETEALSSWALEPLGDKLDLLFLNPTRLKFRGELVSDPPFHVLLRNLIRRIDLLSEVHGEGSLGLDAPALIEKAQAITTEASNLHWLDWKRHSNRQKRSVKSGGFVGRVTYKGDFTPFLSLLGAGRLTHVGKSTTFGLGAYQIAHQALP
jgi:hypothetical protein